MIKNIDSKSTEQEFLVNTNVLGRFKQLLAKDHLGHAYLFAGPNGAGKAETAVAVAKMVNCLQSGHSKEWYCDQCAQCLKINAKQHPDVHIYESNFIEPIKIEQVRELLSRIKLRPYEGIKKVFVIKNIENFTPEAGNALLKTLEEPSANSLLLLTTTSLEKCLETVVSRCHRVLFYPLAIKTLASRISKYYDVDEAKANFLAALSEGSLGKAKGLKETDAIRKRDEVLNRFIFEPNSEEYLKKVLADKNETKQFLEMLLSWIRDSLLLKSGFNVEWLIHRERSRELADFTKNYTFVQLEELYQQIVHMFKMLAENLNIKVPLLIIKELLHG